MAREQGLGIMKSIVAFGAGNIGRSLVGQLFSRAEYRVVFVDAYQPVVDALNDRGEYTVVVKDDVPPGAPTEYQVRNVSGLPAGDVQAVADAIAEADLIATSVGPTVLPKLAPSIAAGLARRVEPISIIMCENLRNAASHMRGWLADRLPEGFDVAGRVGLVETSIGKMVPIMPLEVTQRDPLVIWAEAYNQIIADRAGFIGEPPAVEGLVLKDNFAAYVDRKLFIHNFGHAAAAYFGYLAGKERIWQCMDAPAIQQRTREAMDATAEALIALYPGEFNAENQREHVEDLLHRFANRALNDSVFRVGRDLHRKLSAEDRCVGSLRLVRSVGADAGPVMDVMAAALRFKAVDEAGQMLPGDHEFHLELARRGPRAILTDICGLDPASEAEAIDGILTRYKALA